MSVSMLIIFFHFVFLPLKLMKHLNPTAVQFQLIILSSIEKLSYKRSATKCKSNFRRHMLPPFAIELNP